MVRRETDPELINKIANHPSVWPFIARHGEPVDFAPAFPMTQTGVVVLTNGEDAAMVFEQTAERAWQVLTMFQDTCRGEKAREVGKAMRDYMAPHADLIFGVVPNNYPHAKKFYEALGGFSVPPIEVEGEKVQALVVGDTPFVAKDGEDLFALKVIH